MQGSATESALKQVTKRAIAQREARTQGPEIKSLVLYSLSQPSTLTLVI